MKHFPIRVGLCGILALVAGDVWAQQVPPTNKPITPAAPAEVKPGQVPPKTVVFLGEPFAYARPRTLNDGVACPPLCPQPIFCWSGNDDCDICAIEALVCRVMNIGTVSINTKKIADVLERGFPDAAPKAKAKAEQANKINVNALVQLAGGDAVELAQAGKDNKENPPPSPESKQITDEINRIFKMQAELLRSMDIGALYRPVMLRPTPSFVPHGAYPCGPFPYGAYPYAGHPWGAGACGASPCGGYPWGGGYPCGGYPGYPWGSVVCDPQGVCYVDGCAMVFNGRTGLELALLLPQAQDLLKLPREQGLYIKEVYAKTPAEAAGFKKSDILIELDGKKVPNSFFDFLNQVFAYVKNDTPIPAVVLRAGQRVEVNGMKITDRRILPPLPHECPIDAVLPNLIQVLPGINSTQQGTARVRELRAVPRPGGITEFIWVDPNEKK